MSAEMIILMLLNATALAFDFTNFFHDTGNAMATSIATGALKPKTGLPGRCSEELLFRAASPAEAVVDGGGGRQGGPFDPEGEQFRLGDRRRDSCCCAGGDREGTQPCGDPPGRV